ncbi:MAG: kelch repeat-containing protein [Acidimicrobiia bacterium]
MPRSCGGRRGMYATAHDTESDRVLLWGGFTGTDENDVAMWAYDYNSDTWEMLESTGGPQQHWERHGMAYIPELDRVLFYSGMLEDEGVLPAETWYSDYNSNTWTEIDVDISPPALAMYAMAYDPGSGKAIVFGGEMTSNTPGTSPPTSGRSIPSPNLGAKVSEPTTE